MPTHDEDPKKATPQPNGGPSSTSLPPIAALFLVKFDNRKGYTVAWNRAVEGLNIEGVVEFKSLPSGLHNVKEDLVYFVHEEYAGVSAFLNTEDDQAERNACMLSIGVLVPLEHGRMGKSWLHAEHLKELCRHLTKRPDDRVQFEQYWDNNHISETVESGSAGGSDIKINIPKKPTGYQLSRSMSVGTVPPASSHILSKHHPALALSQMVHLFGPLILPLYRAALLRKRILLLCEAPVEQACNFVYNISILSSIPRIVAESMNLDSTSDLKLQPLFNVGITDIPFLSAQKSEAEPNPPGSQTVGWIASTTDDVLCTKPDLFDLLIRLPNADALRVRPREYPKIVVSSPELARAYPKVGLRASLRDAKRYQSLAVGVKKFPISSKTDAETAVEDTEESEEADGLSVASSISSGVSRTSVVEPQGWGRIAYTSLVWWASAGDKRSGLVEAEENEDEQDLALLGSDSPSLDMDDDEGNDGETREVAIIGFFHRLSSLIFEVLGAAVRRSDTAEDEPYRDEVEDTDRPHKHSNQSQDPSSDDDQSSLLRGRDRDDSEETQGPIVEITPEEVAQMGLDIWSEADRKFIEEMVSFWWGREASVLGGKVECCGLRIM